jgi:Na+/H+-dicarboxylate symporter
MKTAALKQVSSLSLAGMTTAFGLVLGLAWATSFMPAPASAQSRGTPEQQQACQPDAMRLCGEFVPDVERITACMIKNRIRLSPPCRAVFSASPHKEKSFKHN